MYTANPDLLISYFSSQSSAKTHFSVIYSRNSYVLAVFQHYSFAFLDTHCFLMVRQSADNFMMGFYIRGVILMEIIKAKSDKVCGLFNKIHDAYYKNTSRFSITG